MTLREIGALSFERKGIKGRAPKDQAEASKQRGNCHHVDKWSRLPRLIRNTIDAQAVVWCPVYPIKGQNPGRGGGRMGDVSAR